MRERLQKILSQRGVCSRRKAEEYLRAGLVKVNGKPAALGDKADPAVDTIAVEGTVLEDRAKMLYYVMNKPVGYETTNSERSPATQASTHDATNTAPSVRDLLPSSLRGKIFPIGRLDKDSEGLLLFTNDGVLSYRLTHPKFHHEKEYEVEVDRAIEPLPLRKMEQGFVLDGTMTKPLKCRKVSTRRARIILTEGRNRQIRRMVQHVGYTVRSLRRVRIMSFEDDSLPLGSVRALTEKEKSTLLHSVGIGENLSKN